MPPPPLLPDLIDDVVGEILLRLPPDEPEHLFHASAVCKPWLRVVTEPVFLRGYRAFHGAPPLLGVVHRHGFEDGYRVVYRRTPHFTPTTAVPAFIPPLSAGYCSQTIDCRHGRVLLAFPLFTTPKEFFVWDPATGDGHRLPKLELHPILPYSAAVLCATAGCDHLHCHEGPFCVVFIASDSLGSLWVSLYSSETDAWRSVTSGEGKLLHDSRCAVIGDEIYFILSQDIAIVKYNWRNNCLSEVNPAPPPQPHGSSFTVILMEDSSLGLASYEEDSGSLYVWSRKVNAEGAAEWVQCYVIELGTVIPMAGPDDKAIFLGFQEVVGVSVIFLSTGAGLFIFELNSRQMRKVGEAGNYSSGFPYMSYYTPGCTRLHGPADYFQGKKRVLCFEEKEKMPRDILKHNLLLLLAVLLPLSCLFFVRMFNDGM